MLDVPIAEIGYTMHIAEVAELFAGSRRMNIRNSLELILGSSHPRFSDRFYRNFFRQYPEVKAYFEGVDLRRQGILLVMAVQIIIDHHLRPHLAMENYLRILGNRHHQIGIEVTDYQKFESALLTTLEGFHGEQWDKESEPPAEPVA
jgi:hemoglobin-like flavoprotein